MMQPKIVFFSQKPIESILKLTAQVIWPTKKFVLFNISLRKSSLRSNNGGTYNINCRAIFLKPLAICAAGENIFNYVKVSNSAKMTKFFFFIVHSLKEY